MSDRAESWLLFAVAAACMAVGFAVIPDPRTLTWRAPDGRVVYQSAREGETWRLAPEGWVLVAPVGSDR